MTQLSSDFLAGMRPASTTPARVPAGPVRRSLQVIWAVYLPLAILLAAVVAAGGCNTTSAEERAATTREAAERIERAEDTADRGYPRQTPFMGTADARADVRYSRDRLQIVQFTGETWKDYELWVNQRYVATPAPLEPNKPQTLQFAAFRDRQGRMIPSSVENEAIDTLEVFMNGVIYEIPVGLAE